jgi:hypothetical protein
VTEIEFRPWPKIARLNRDITVTEKIDGTNAAILIAEVDPDSDPGEFEISNVWDDTSVDERLLGIYAQSRTRFITPGQDNHGFAAWVWANATGLVNTLGPGRHFGEWWGSGINRGYGLPQGEKRFSLFNTSKWRDVDLTTVPGLRVVPVLYEGPFSQNEIIIAQADLQLGGSYAAECEGVTFMDPEGVVVFHVAANEMFKVTIKGDEKPKGQTA